MSSPDAPATLLSPNRSVKDAANAGAAEPSSSGREHISAGAHELGTAKPEKMDAALGRFKSGSLNFQTLISELVAASEAERQQLEEARRQLDEERHAWELERQRMHTILNDAEQVTLNVGGLRFTTSLSTLRNAPSPCLFNAMFSGRHKLSKDEAGCYFIDRDGRHFHDILNYLRDGHFNFPGPGLPDAAHHHHHHHLLQPAAAAAAVVPGSYVLH